MLNTSERSTFAVWAAPRQRQHCGHADQYALMQGADALPWLQTKMKTISDKRTHAHSHTQEVQQLQAAAQRQQQAAASRLGATLQQLSGAETALRASYATAQR